jgi:hypothetical protein
MSMNTMREYLLARKERMLSDIARFKAEHSDEIWFSPGVKATAKSAAGLVEQAESKLGRVGHLLEHGAIGRADQVIDIASEAFKKAKKLIKRASEKEDGFRTETTSKVHES